MLIIKNEGISKIKVTTYPEERNDFKDVLIQDVMLPGVFYMGAKWFIEHNCLICKNKIITGKSLPQYRIVGVLSIKNIKVKELLDDIGFLFNLNLKNEIGLNNSHIYNYSLIGKFKGLAKLAYYFCSTCNAQYLMAYMDLFGEGERNPTPDELYIEKILQVSFDHATFIKTLEE